MSYVNRGDGGLPMFSENGQYSCLVRIHHWMGSPIYGVGEEPGIRVCV